jgi:hypothetical protein
MARLPTQSRGGAADGAARHRPSAASAHDRDVAIAVVGFEAAPKTKAIADEVGQARPATPEF